MTVGPVRDGTWTPVCVAVNIPRGGAVAALVRGRPVAVFRDKDDEIYALGNRDPFDRTTVLARGLVTERGGQPCVATAGITTHLIALRDGTCLDVEGARVPAYTVKVVDGLVHVGPRVEVG